MRQAMKCSIALLAVLCLSACANTGKPFTLYDRLGGEKTIANISRQFVVKIEKSPSIFPFFEESDADRFEQHFQNHLCVLTDGPCVYKGDTMQRVHDGMNIRAAEFNTTVDLLIDAMNDAGVVHRLQNQVLSRLAPLRKDIIYR